MSELLGPVLTTIAVLGISLISWFSRRATHEGRLLLRIERLGTAYAVMPDSPERVEFERHVTQIVSQLNQWLDADTRAWRHLRIAVSATIYVVGVTVVLLLIPVIGGGDPGLQVWLGVAGGLLVGAVKFGISLLVDRWEARKLGAKAQAKRDAEASERFQALRLGNQPPAAAESNANPRSLKS